MISSLNRFAAWQGKCSEKNWQKICQGVDWDGFDAPTWNEVGHMRDALQDFLERYDETLYGNSL